MRRLVALTAALVVVEAAMFAAITPLLAHLGEMGMSRVEGGVLNATYALGLVPGSALAGWCLRPMGVRRVTIIGVAVFAAATALFGVVQGLIALDIARTLQGVAAGFMWGGGMAWLIGESPADRRGQYLGTAMGFTIMGTLVGPLIGALAVATGMDLVYGLSAVAILALIWPISRTPARPKPVATRGFRAAVAASSNLRLGMWMYLLTGAVLAAVGTLVPLHLAEEGVQPETVGAIFVVASLVAALVARPVGVWTDRRGPLPLSVVGLLVAIPALAVSALASSAAGLAAAAVAGTVSGFFVAVTAGRLMAGAAAGVGISVGTTGPLMQFTSATGEILGAIGGAVCAVAIGDGAPFLLLSGLALATLTYILRRSVGGRAGLAGET